MAHEPIKPLIAQYIVRQQFVVQAILELRPDLFAVADKNVSAYNSWLIANQYKDVPGKGLWEKDGQWTYYVHGCGCRLTNLETREPLEWDVPHREAFNPDWFVNWYYWAVKRLQTPENMNQDKPYTVLRDLLSEGYLARATKSGKLKIATLENNLVPELAQPRIRFWSVMRNLFRLQ